MGAMNVVRIVSVKPPKSDRGPYVITDSEGTQYATKHVLLASLAERMCKLQAPVFIHGGGGWFYRELIGIVPATGADLEPQEASAS